MEKTNIVAFAISGPNVRTNNTLEASAAGKIPGLWGAFYASSPNPAAKMYGVYSDYESNFNGDFTVTAGSKVADINTASVCIKSGMYLAFPANGAMPAAIIGAWQNVWQHFSTEQAYTRCYETDFEEYNGPESATIYIGIKVAS